MKIIRMNASSFWKGEAGVKGLVEDHLSLLIKWIYSCLWMELGNVLH